MLDDFETCQLWQNFRRSISVKLVILFNWLLTAWDDTACRNRIILGRVQKKVGLMWFVEPLNVVFHVVRFAVGYITIMHTVTSVTTAMNINNLSDKQP